MTASMVCAVLLRQECIEWCGEMKRSADQPLEETLAALLATVPRRGVRRAHVHASVGPQGSQVRNVGEQGWSRNRQLAYAVVRESPTRFFLVNGTPLVTTGVQQSPDGGTLVGAVDRPVVEAITNACRGARMRLIAISPAAAVLGLAIEGTHAVLRDGDLSTLATYQGTLLCSSRRVRSAELPMAEQDQLAVHRALRERVPGIHVVIAYGAARAGRTLQLVIAPTRAASSGPRRTVLAASMCALAVAFALITPPATAAHRAERARASRRVTARSGARALDAERRLGEAIATVRELNSFSRQRRSATLVLASLSEAIEAPTMLLSIHADTVGGTLVALTPRAALLMTMLDSVTDIMDARILGPVTSQAAGDRISAMPVPGDGRTAEAARAMERVTVRFAWRDARGAR